MADKAIPDISLGGAEQNMSREELAAVAKAVAALSPEDRDLLVAVQESPFRLTTAEQFLEFEKNVDCFVLEPHVQTLEDLGWEYLEEKLTIDLTDDLRAAIDPPPSAGAPWRRTGGASPAGLSVPHGRPMAA